MARRGLDQITVRLEDDVLQELRRLAPAGRGRAGGAAFYLRRLIYRDLGRPLPEQHAAEPPQVVSPRLATRLQDWLEAGSEREELLEAAHLLARKLGLELAGTQELARLRKAAAAPRPAAPVPSLPPGLEFQEGRIAGLTQALEIAQGLADYHAREPGLLARTLTEGLQPLLERLRSLRAEIQRNRDRAEELGKRQHLDPLWLRSQARQLQALLRRDPEDRKAREALAQLQGIAHLAGVELPSAEAPRGGAEAPGPAGTEGGPRLKAGAREPARERSRRRGDGARGDAGGSGRPGT